MSPSQHPPYLEQRYLDEAEDLALQEPHSHEDCMTHTGYTQRTAINGHAIAKARGPTTEGVTKDSWLPARPLKKQLERPKITEGPSTKRARRLKSKRETVKRCRMRRRGRIDDVKSQAEEAETSNRQLRAMNEKLNKQVQRLKGGLQRHVDIGCNSEKCIQPDKIPPSCIGINLGGGVESCDGETASIKHGQEIYHSEASDESTMEK
jgi:hypothetical protein